MADTQLKILISSLLDSSGFDKANRSIGDIGVSLKSLDSVAKSAAGAIAGYFAFSTIKDSIKQTIDLADSLNKMSQKVGVSVDSLYAMQAAGKLADVSMESLEKGLAKFNKGLGLASMGSGDTANALKNLGISLKDSSGHLKNSDQYLSEVSDKFQAMPDGIAKTTLAMQLFGKSGAELIPLLDGGSASLKEFSGIMNADTAKDAERINDSFTRMGLAFESSKTKILTGMLPAIESLSSTMEGFAKRTTENKDSIASFTNRAGNDLTALGIVGHDAFGLISDTSTEMLKVVNSVFSAIPNLIGESSNDAINNFGFFEYFILGMSTATNGIAQFVANAKMAYADVAEFKAKYGSVGGILTNGGYDAASARLDKAYAQSDAEKATKNVVDTYNTLLGLKKDFVAKSASIKSPTADIDLEDYAKNEAANKKALEKAQKIQNAYTDMYAELYKISHNDYENEVLQIDDKAKKYLQEVSNFTEKAKAKKYIQDVADFTEKSKADLKAKYTAKADEEALEAIKKFNEEQAKLEFEADQTREEALKTYNAGLVTAQIDYYTAIGNTSAAYYLQEEEKIKKLAETGWYTNEQMLAIKTADNDKFQKEQWAKDNKFWADLFDNINKAMDDQFFNAMTGKFKSFGSWLKDFWSSITNSMARGLSKSLADSILGTGNSSGGIVNMFKSFGGLAGATGSIGTLVGTTLSASDYASVVNKYGAVAGMTVTPDGTTIDNAGKITSIGSGSDIGSLLNIASSLKTAYTAITGGLSTSIADAFASGAAYTYNGLTSIGISADTAGSIAGGIGNFGAGLSSPFASAGSGGAAGAGAMLGGAALGAAGGYALGSLGDKLFGANTKASSYGAIGGAIGSFAGPIGAIVGASLGSIIGGMFGSTKSTGSGYYFNNNTTTGSNGQSYVDYKKKSWFKSSSWTDYQALSDVDKMQVKGLFDTYDYLFTQLGSYKKISLDAGRYSGTTFQDQLAKNFITAFTNVEQSNSTFSTIYSYWVDYAKSINKTVAEALTSSVGTYISETRTFNEWKLGSGTTEQLKFTADYLSKDLSALETQIGVSGVTVDNYLSMYDEAIKKNFTPETINSWKSLGDALMGATDANKKYTDSLKALTANTPTIPQDMILSKSLDGSQLFTTISTQSDTMRYSFSEMITLLKKMLYNQQFGVQPI
jgi:hypothetical protein